MTQKTSVIVVTQNRAQPLRLCLLGLSQLDYPDFEIIVVGDRGGLDVVDNLGLTDRIKTVPFDTPNISMARNAGLAVASGRFVAFIDDDAVPEPTWLTHLIAPLVSGPAVASGGYVLGRNGLTFQWTARDARADGTSQAIAMTSEDPVTICGRKGWGAKTEGTNMAFDRDVICRMGGFDPAFDFYLDETDLNLRLAEAGASTTLVPLAQVHHGYAASDRRRRDRVPTSLFQIGRSLAIFLRKHGLGDPEARITEEVAIQRARLLRHMVAGRMLPSEVAPLLETFHQGAVAGGQALLEDLQPIVGAGLFLPFVTTVQGHKSYNGRWTKRRDLMAQAINARQSGHRSSVFLYSLTALFHRVTFDESGVWVQSGGLFGKARRDDPVWRKWSMNDRTRYELQRIAKIRGTSA